MVTTAKATKTQQQLMFLVFIMAEKLYLQGKTEFCWYLRIFVYL